MCRLLVIPTDFPKHCRNAVVSALGETSPKAKPGKNLKILLNSHLPGKCRVKSDAKCNKNFIKKVRLSWLTKINSP
jgi:hypothetical protein